MREIASEHGQKGGDSGQPPRPMDEETARWYVEKYGDHVSNAMAIDLARVESGDVVLDIGCGSGAAVRKAAVLATDGHVIGIDPSAAMLRIAAELTATALGRHRIEYLDGSAESIPLHIDKVTIALAINTIHHWYDLERGLSEAARVLVPGGRLLIVEERLRGGGFGHGQGPTSDPKHVARAMRTVGFGDVTITTHSRGDDAVTYVVGTNTKAQERSPCVAP